MTVKDWEEEVTPPQAPAGRAVLRAAATDAKRAHDRLDDIDEAIGKLAAEVGSMRREMQSGFARLGDLADKAFRKAENSSHDLSAFALETRRKFMLKNASLPTAIVVASFIIGYVVLLAMGKPIPAPFVAVAGAVSTIVAGMLPALLGGGNPPPNGGAS